MAWAPFKCSSRTFGVAKVHTSLDRLMFSVTVSFGPIRLAFGETRDRRVDVFRLLSCVARVWSSTLVRKRRYGTAHDFTRTATGNSRLWRALLIIGKMPMASMVLRAGAFYRCKVTSKVSKYSDLPPIGSKRLSFPANMTFLQLATRL